MSFPNINSYPLTSLIVNITAENFVISTRGNYFEFNDTKNERNGSVNSIVQTTRVVLNIPFTELEAPILSAKRPISVDVLLRSGETLTYQVLSVDQTKSNGTNGALDTLTLVLKGRTT